MLTDCYALIGAAAHLLLDSIEKDDPPDERLDATGRRAFEDGFRVGLGLAVQSLAYRLTASDFDPGWTEEEVGELA